jgi:hypothetical protein
MHDSSQLCYAQQVLQGRCRLSKNAAVMVCPRPARQDGLRAQPQALNLFTPQGSEKLLECGTTCTAVVLHGRYVVLANVGDSAAVVGRGGYGPGAPGLGVGPDPPTRSAGGSGKLAAGAMAGAGACVMPTFTISPQVSTSQLELPGRLGWGGGGPAAASPDRLRRSPSRTVTDAFGLTEHAQVARWP